MKECGWRKRLIDAIKSDGRKPTAISRAASLGPNYIREQIFAGKAPGVDAVLKLCRELEISAGYIFLGLRMTKEEQELLTRFSSLPERQKDTFLAFLRSLETDDEAHE